MTSIARAIAAGITLGLTATVAVVTTSTTPALAVTKSTVVTYDRCDVRTTANDPNTRVGPVFSWSPTVTVDLTTPVQVNDEVPVRFTMSEFPAGKIPVSIPEAGRYYTPYVTYSSGGQTSFGKTVAESAITPDAPLPMGESEKDVWFTKAGLVNWFADEFSMDVQGYDTEDDWHRFYIKCDEPSTSQLVATIPVWDPAAKAAVALSTTTVTQGAGVTFTGSGFRPDESVKFLVDNAVVATTATTEIGSAVHTWSAAPFLKPGVHVVKLESTVSAKSVEANLTVVAASAKATVKPKKVKPGKKITAKGSLFKPGEKVTLTFKRTAGGKGLKSKSYGSVTATAGGTVSKQLKVVKKFAKGKHAIVLTGTESGRVGTAKMTVKAAKKK
jgi:hypothetical protein